MLTLETSTLATLPRGRSIPVHSGPRLGVCLNLREVPFLGVCVYTELEKEGEAKQRRANDLFFVPLLTFCKFEVGSACRPIGFASFARFAHGALEKRRGNLGTFCRST